MIRKGLATHTGRLLGAAALMAGVALATLSSPASAQSEKTLVLPMRTDGPKTLDPVEGSTVYENMAVSQVYETLLENKYADPLNFEPRLLEELPTTPDEGLTWRFRLKQGVRFHDNVCFPGGRGRELVTDDVFYSLKRIADKKYLFKNWWLLENTIDGFDEFRTVQNEAETFDYSAPVRGFRKINDREFEIRLVEPVASFLWKLSMFQTSIVPREAVEHYGADFRFNPVGTGPFILRSSDDYRSQRSLTLHRNPNYHDVRYPGRNEWSSEDRRNRMHLDAGKQVPFVDRIVFQMFIQDQPMWLRFEDGTLAYTEVPAEFFEQAFVRETQRLRPAMVSKGVTAHNNPLLDFIFRGFNMEDALLGGYTPERRALRQAINLAIDLEEFNQAFYQGLTIVYDGPIPPGLDGHPEGGRAPISYRGPNLDLARQKLAEAGYPNGEGLPPIEFYTSRGGNNEEQVEMMKRQLARVGIRLQPRLLDFSELISTVDRKAAPMFGFAWSSDYPDGENNLALFYGPNESPGSNHYNYKRAEYDRLYEKIRTMQPSPERSAIYEQMRDMLIEDAPFVGSMARNRFYLINPWVKNFRPTERYYGWFKFVDVDEAGRTR